MSAARSDVGVEVGSAAGSGIGGPGGGPGDGALAYGGTHGGTGGPHDEVQDAVARAASPEDLARALLSAAIAERALLTAAQEVALAKRMHGDERALTPGERELLDALDAPSSQLAECRLVQHNLRLVAKYVATFVRRNGLPVGLTRDDLLQEGTIGLIRGAHKYDWRKGFRFATYVMWWVRQGVGRAAPEGEVVHVPLYAITLRNQVRRAVKAFVAASGREPRDDELTQQYAFSEEELAVARAAERAEQPIPLSTPVAISRRRGGSVDSHADGAPRTLEQSLEDPSALDALARADAIGQAFAPPLQRLLAQELNARERLILLARAGLLEPDGRVLPLEEIGRRLGITRERVRQIELALIERLTAAGLKPTGAVVPPSPEQEAARRARRRKRPSGGLSPAALGAAWVVASTAARTAPQRRSRPQSAPRAQPSRAQPSRAQPSRAQPSRAQPAPRS